MSSPQRRKELAVIRAQEEELNERMREARREERCAKVEDFTELLRAFGAAIREDVKYDNFGRVEEAARNVSEHILNLILGEV